MNHDLEDDMSSEETVESEEEEEKYPWWLDKIMSADGEYDDTVKVLEEEEDNSQPGFKRCKEIIVPDTIDAADKREQVRQRKLKRSTIIMIISEPETAPYIGWIEKIWRKTDAKPRNGVAGNYAIADFRVECYWFYRPREVPEYAWVDAKKPPKDIKGAQYAWTKRSRPQLEQTSERQLLFSSHHTLHDYPDDNGLLSLDGFLQVCEPVHWIKEMRAEPPMRYAIHNQKLVRTRDPGFVVRGFLYCNEKQKQQFHADDKRAYALDGKWKDKATMDIVAHMVEKSEKRARKVAKRNEEIRQKYIQFKLKQRAGHATAPLASDSGSLRTEQPTRVAQQQQQQQHRQPQQQQKGGVVDSDSEEDIPLSVRGGLQHQGSGGPSLVQQQRQGEATGFVAQPRGVGAGGNAGAPRELKQNTPKRSGGVGSSREATAGGEGAREQGAFDSSDDDE